MLPVDVPLGEGDGKTTVLKAIISAADCDHVAAWQQGVGTAPGDEEEWGFHRTTDCVYWTSAQTPMMAFRWIAAK